MHALFIEWFKQVIDSVDFKSFNRVLVEGGAKDDLGQRDFLVDQFLDHAKTVEPRHLEIKKQDVRRMLFDQVHRFQAIVALGDDAHIIHGFEQVTQLVARELLVIDYDCGKSQSKILPLQYRGWVRVCSIRKLSVASGRPKKL